MNTNTSLRIVVAMLLGTTMQGAFAYGPTDPIKFANESADITGVTPVAAAIAAGFDIPVISGKVVSSTAPYFVVITLKDGATFGTAATTMELKCGYTNYNSVSGAAPASPSAVVTAITDSPAAVQGGSVAAFKLQSGGSTGCLTGTLACAGTDITTLGKLTASKCTLTLPANSIQLASGKKDYGVSVVARHQDPSDGASATVNGTIVSFTQGMQLSVSAGSVTVDVTSPSLSKKFLVTGSVATTSAGLVTTAVAALGIIRYTPVPGVLTMAGGVAPTNGSYLTTFNLTVSGSPIGAAQSTAAVGVVSGGIYLSDGAAAPTSACAGSGAGGAGGAPNTLRVSSGNQVSFVAVPAAMLHAANGLSVCMIGNEVSIVDRGVVSFTIDGITGAAGGTPNLSSVDSTLVKVVKNGTSIKVLNIPSPDYSVDQAYTRLYNMGTLPGKVFGTLYNPGDASNAGAGTVMGTPNAVLVESLAPNAVAVLTPADLARIFGLPSWNGRAWMQIESEIKGLRAQALMRNGPSGVLMNMGDRVLGDSECLTRETCVNAAN